MEKAATSNKWFVEPLSDHLIHMSSIKSVLFHSQSKFQDVDILDLGSFGKCLVLDNKIQSSACDEFIYHESLCHPALLAHPNPKSVFIGGGGEGATAREVLRHRTVERVVMIDIDEEVVDMCRKELPDHHQGAFEDPRLEIHYEDAKMWLENCTEKFDVIVLDLADPLEAGPCYLLYTQNFYKLLKGKLNPGGIVVTQSGPCGLLSHKDVFAPVHNTLKSVFGHVCGYSAHIPSFMDMYGFNIASDEPLKDAADLDERIKERVNGECQFYDHATHQNMFSLPKPIRTSLAKETRVSTEEAPAFMVC